MSTQPKGYTIRWWLVRHAPVINPDDLAYGAMDLDAQFDQMQAQVAFLRQTLPTTANVRTSGLRRSQQTLRAVWADQDFAVDPRWNEQGLGDWEGQSRQAIYGPKGPVRALFQDPENFRPPRTSPHSPPAENWTDLSQRVAQSLDDADKQRTSRDEIVFAHAGTIRAALGHALTLCAERSFGFVVNHMSLTRIESVHFWDQDQWQQRWRLQGVNMGPALRDDR